jgi:vitamin B12 transporter
MKNHLIGSLAILAISAPLSVFADSSKNSAPNIEEIVVTSSRVPTPLRQIGTSVSVITEEEIKQLGYATLYDALRTQPGVGVSSQNGPGSITSLRIRGEEGYRTRFYLDGINIADNASPQPATRTEHILSSSVQRVEILRGPQGLMYGADAGGVVNISTISPADGINGSVSAEAGRYDTSQLAGNINGRSGILDFSLSATRYESDSFNAWTLDAGPEDDDGYENTTLHGRFGAQLTEATRLSLVVRDVEGDNDYDSCFVPSDDCVSEYNQEAWRVAVNHDGESLSHELFYNESEIDEDYFSDGFFSFDRHGKLEQAGYIGSFRHSDALSLAYGVDLLTESLGDGIGKTTRDQDAYYAEYQGGFNDMLFVTAGVRHDDNDDFDGHTSYRLSGAYLIPLEQGEIKLRATQGTGFRAPSLYEINTNQGLWTLPPAAGFELSEEESEGYDLAASWTGNNGLYLELVYFDQEINDEIFYDNNSFGYLQISGDTQSEGVELIADWNFSQGFSASANYTYTDSQDKEGNQRARRPESIANLGLRWALLDQQLVLGVNARLSRDAVDIDGSDMDDYEVIDINASFAVSDALEVFGRIENLTDEDYEEVPNYNTSGAAGYLGVRYSFQE